MNSFHPFGWYLLIRLLHREPSLLAGRFKNVVEEFQQLATVRLGMSTPLKRTVHHPWTID